MVQILNQLTFQKFGIISNDKTPDIPALQAKTGLLLSRKDVPVYFADGPIYLCPEPGLCVLSVSFEDGNFENFYLDKSVYLKENTFFFLTPFHDNTTVQMFGNPTHVRTLTESMDFRVKPRLVISHLYTFFYQEQEQAFVFPGEAHPMLELTYVDKGTMHSVADGQDLLLQTGDMALYDANQWHVQYSDIGVAPCHVTISFDAEGMDLSALMNRKIKTPPKAVAILQQMLREQEKPDQYSEDMILCLLTNFLLTVLRCIDVPSEPIRTPQCINNENDIIRRAQQYIRENVRAKLSVPLVAKNTDVSPSYLTSLFHKHLQISPGEYIRRVKLQESKQMIREGNMNFSQIAAALHYSTIHHFSRLFKEKYGITPTEYAKSIK